MRFTTILCEFESGTTGIVVPPEIIDQLEAGKKPPVVVVLNGRYSFRSTVAVMGGRFLISFSAQRRKESGLAGGDQIDVDLQLDTEPREVPVPPSLADALARDPAAKAVFDSLSNSRKRVYTLSVEGAKTAETRDRRVEKALAALRSDGH